MFKQGENGFKIIAIIVVVLIIAIIGIVSSILSNSSNQIENIAEDPYEYFQVYSLDETIGVVDRNGNPIIDSKYTEIYIPNQSKDVFFCFEDEENYIILNKDGNEIFTEYEEVEPIIIYSGNFDMEKNVLSYESDGKYGLINFDGKKLTEAIYDSVSSLPNKPGCILVKKDGLFGVVDSEGNIVIDTKYNSINGDEYCSEEDGYYKTGYIISEKTSSGIIYGYIDYKGKELLSPKYESITRCIDYDTSDVYLIFMDNGKKGIIKNSKIIIQPKYQSIVYYSVSKVFAVCKNNKYGIYSQSGDEILPVNFTEYSVAGNYISVKKDDSMLLYDCHGNLINTDTYRSIIETDNPDYFIAIDDSGYYSIISKEVQISNNYTDINYAFDNFFIYKTEEGLYGVLNAYTGIEVEAKYDMILVMDSVNALEAKNGTTTDIYSRKIEKIATIENAIVEKVADGYVSIYSSNDLIYINSEGELVENTVVFPNLAIYSYKDENEKWGFKDKDGNIVLNAEYDIVTELNEYGFAGIYKEGKWGVIDSTGKVIVEPSYEIESYYSPNFIGKYQCESLGSVYCTELD